MSIFKASDMHFNAYQCILQPNIILHVSGSLYRPIYGPGILLRSVDRVCEIRSIRPTHFALERTTSHQASTLSERLTLYVITNATITAQHQSVVGMSSVRARHGAQ